MSVTYNMSKWFAVLSMATWTKPDQSNWITYLIDFINLLIIYSIPVRKWKSITCFFVGKTPTHEKWPLLPFPYLDISVQDQKNELWSWNDYHLAFNIYISVL